MLSRVADSLYWMSRYMERAEHVTRLLDVNLNLMLDESAIQRRPSSGSACCRPWAVPRTCNGPRADPYALTQMLSFDTEYSRFHPLLHHLGP